MKEKDLRKLGVPRGEATRLALKAIAAARVAGLDRTTVLTRLKGVLAVPASFAGDVLFGALARTLDGAPRPAPFAHRVRPAAYRTWGSGHEPTAVQQMENACSLPVSVAGALMPDAH